MKLVVKIIVIVAIYLPYRIFFGTENGFWIDFVIVFAAFMIANGLTAVIFRDDTKPPEDS